jgi:hypothetical protein
MLHYYHCWFNAYIVEQVLDLLLWLFIQCFYVVDSMLILWNRYWFLYYVWLLNIRIMGQILVPILCFLVQFLYYEADTYYYIISVGSMLVLRVVDSIHILWSSYWFLCYGCSLNVCIMGQVLVLILCFLAQCLYYEAMPTYFRTCLACLQCRVKMFFDSTLAGFRGCWITERLWNVATKILTNLQCQQYVTQY